MNLPLAFVPNQEGFKFKGIKHNGEALQCVVRKDEQGMHYIADQQGNKCYKEIKVWVK